MDKTRLYQALYSDAHSAFDRRSPAMQEVAFLFVPGVMTDLAGEAERFMAILPRGDCFDDHRQALEDAGTSVGLVELAASASTATNGRRIAAAVRRLNRAGLRVVLISHGKGGLDTLEALLPGRSRRAARLTAGEVAGWIALQTPFHGTPLADDGPGAGLLLDGALRSALAAGPCGLKEMAPARRRAGLDARANAIASLLDEIPMLSVATCVDQPAQAHALLRASLGHLLDRGIASDGLVPTVSARLPGSDFVTLRNVDHLASVAGSLLAPETPGFERVRALKALLLTLLGSASAELSRPAQHGLRLPFVASHELPPVAEGRPEPGYMLSP